MDKRVDYSDFWPIAGEAYARYRAACIEELENESPRHTLEYWVFVVCKERMKDGV